MAKNQYIKKNPVNNKSEPEKSSIHKSYLQMQTLQ